MAEKLDNCFSEFETGNFNELDICSDNDRDTCSAEEIETQFNVPYYLWNEEAVTLNTNYILHLTGSGYSDPYIGVGLSDKSCMIYQITSNSLAKLCKFNAHSDTISNIRFSNENPKLFYSGSTDGIIKLWDLRTSECSLEIKDDSSGVENLKPISSFDISPNDRLLCGGTELVNGDAFLLFWDLRKSSLLGGYWESHTDDITQVVFHPTNPDMLSSGSTDGLINVFDLSQTSEDDALLYTYNTESSVEKLNWYLFEGRDPALHWVTHTGILELWNINDNEPYVKFTREDLAKTLQRISMEDSYIADVLTYDSKGSLLVVAGSNVQRGECLRTIKVENGELKSLSHLAGNKQIVRSTWYDQRTETIFTGGEYGILSVWKPGQQQINSPDSKLKDKFKHKNVLHKNKPY